MPGACPPRPQAPARMEVDQIDEGQRPAQGQRQDQVTPRPTTTARAMKASFRPPMVGWSSARRRGQCRRTRENQGVPASTAAAARKNPGAAARNPPVRARGREPGRHGRRWRRGAAVRRCPGHHRQDLHQGAEHDMQHEADGNQMGCRPGRGVQREASTPALRRGEGRRLTARTAAR